MVEKTPLCDTSPGADGPAADVRDRIPNYSALVPDYQQNFVAVNTHPRPNGEKYYILNINRTTSDGHTMLRHMRVEGNRADPDQEGKRFDYNPELAAKIKTAAEAALKCDLKPAVALSHELHGDLPKPEGYTSRALRAVTKMLPF